MEVLELSQLNQLLALFINIIDLDCIYMEVFSLTPGLIAANSIY